ncbi:hypothetical protein L226DRAFT_611154 [Lentinus tigrinus ALCF2SS1-7]|uniref:Histone H1 n=1 Tax=Lentinus tigrinus ALCF2SS1-6 TaxID=1328759 RepID=A0A5C2SER9_9APHY|nr:hypothetical protein L227DRAFT_651801 [Lentinus tigrinus ALCF2SS1-6]RPD77981.1 hypothetical protein L226DRAFT_611154 [Lentinus tigrinus ALCF2SS1-7]
MLDPSLLPPSADSSAQNGSAENTHVHEIPPIPSADSDTDKRKTYLSLLPHEQIIKICLLFEPHVPLQVKTTVWPVDLDAAILELKKKADTLPLSPPKPDAPTPVSVSNDAPLPTDTSTPAHQVNPPGPNVPPPHPPDEDPPMGSLRDPAEEAREREQASAAKPIESHTASPAPPNPQTNGNAVASSSRHPTPSGTPQPQGPAQHATLRPPGPYPYAPYGYAMPPQPPGQQAAYPHAPYYPPSGYPSHYPYPYHPPPGYPPPPGHTPPPPGGQPLFNTNPLGRPPHPPQPPPPSGEDLPSYEEMIVEALLDCGEAEGAAPKDLFTWMASRYPLQTNFRPSASQALQKAYKRGRLEKRENGKYRLNAAWEGGATSKRTTRRPQTIAQSTYAMHHPPQPSSPFTTAPLQHNNHPHPPPGQQPPPYNGYSYQYPYGGHYPGYPPQQRPPQDKPPASTSIDNASAAKSAEAKEEGDAWEAAQHILKAINFGGLAQTNTTDASRPGASSGADAEPSTAADDELTAVLHALASAAAAASSAEPPRSTLSDDERASLQAQLALLAAQLTEIAEAEEDEGPPPAPVPEPPSVPEPVPLSAAQASVSQPLHAPAPTAQVQPLAQPEPQPASVQPQAQMPVPAPAPPPRAEPSPMKTVEQHPPPIAAFSGAHLVLDVNAFPEEFLPPSVPAPGSGAQTDVEMDADADADGDVDVDAEGEEVSDEDEDMEDVVVPLHPSMHAGHDALRT